MATELSTSQMLEIDKLVREFEEEQIRVLGNNAAAAHVVGDVQAHKALKMKLHMDLINEEAAKFAKKYIKDLQKGGCFIQGEWVPWLADRSKEDREKIASIIQQGYLKGKATGTKQMVRGGKYGQYPKDTIAGDLQEYFNMRRSHASMVARTEIARIQVQGSLTRYHKQNVKKVLWLTFEPCQICEQFNRRIFAIDDMPYEIPVHPHCRCAVAPVPDDAPTGPAPEQEVPEGFAEPLPYKAPEGKPATTKHDQAVAPFKHDDLGWTSSEGKFWAGEITEAQHDAVENYVTGDYTEFNLFLRGPEAIEAAAQKMASRVDPAAFVRGVQSRSKGYIKQRDHLDALIEAHRLPGDAVLYRSCGTQTAEGLLKNGIYEATNYQSTSTSLSTAEWFGSRTSDGYKNILVMNAEKGSKGYYIGGRENEILLPRGVKFKLLDIREVETTETTEAISGKPQGLTKTRYLIVKAIMP